MHYPIEITLKRPVTVGGKTYDKLVFDEPDLGTSIAVEEAGTSGEQTLLLLAGMAGVDREVMAKVKETDIPEITRRVLDPYQEHVAANAEGASGNAEAAK